MKILSVTPSISRGAGGLFESVKRLHQELVKLPNVAVEVIALKDEFSDTDKQSWSPINPILCRTIGPKMFGYAPTLKHHLMYKSDCDIVHQHGIWMYPSSAILSAQRKTKLPVVISPHGMLDPWAMGNSRWKKRIASLFYQDENLKRASCLRALCESEAEAFRKLGLKNPICIVPNGIDIPHLTTNDVELDSEKKRIRHTTQDRRILLYLGRLHKKKGIINLLHAWKQASTQTSPNDWLLAIAGWDQNDHEKELKRLCIKLNIPFADIRNNDPSTTSSQPASVLFLGPKYDSAKIAWYQACNAFILPSLSEGVPMVVLEAWTHKKPVLITPECNLPEGFKMNAAMRIEATVESISQGLNKLFRTPSEHLRSIGDSGFQIVSSKYEWGKVANEINDVNKWLNT